MIRRIVCLECCDKDRLYYVRKRDRCNWMQRHVFVSLTSEQCRCDECNKPLDSMIVHAVTMWKGGEPEPPHWEEDFGVIVPAINVKMAEALTKERGEE